MKKQLLIIVLMIIAFAGYSQKKQLIEYKEDIIAAAIAELDIACSSPEGTIYKQATDISGKYVFDITIRERGMTATVFVVNDGENPIQMQNKLKDIVKNFKFSFKVPKGKSYKFQYTFKF